MDKCYVYGLYDKDNIIIRYIGVSVKPTKRLYHHIYESKHKYTLNLGKSKWIRTVKNIGIKILFSGTEKECYEKEIELILKYKTKRNLTNATNGGDRPCRINELPESIFQEIRVKISDSRKGGVATNETRKKMSDSQKLVQRPYLALNQKGADNPRAKKVAQYDMNGVHIKTWDYAQEAIQFLKLNRSAITDCLKGRQKSTGGYKWELAK